MSAFLRNVTITNDDPSVFSVHAQWDYVSPIQGGAKFSGSTNDQRIGVALKQS